jgi:hypothetical protein
MPTHSGLPDGKSIFIPKIPIWVYFAELLVYSMAILEYFSTFWYILWLFCIFFLSVWYILCLFGIFQGSFVYFMAVLNILGPFCIFCGHLVIWYVVPRKIWQP